MSVLEENAASCLAHKLYTLNEDPVHGRSCVGIVNVRRRWLDIVCLDFHLRLTVLRLDEVGKEERVDKLSFGGFRHVGIALRNTAQSGVQDEGNRC